MTFLTQTLNQKPEIKTPALFAKCANKDGAPGFLHSYMVLLDWATGGVVGVVAPGLGAYFEAHLACKCLA